MRKNCLKASMAAALAALLLASPAAALGGEVYDAAAALAAGPSRRVADYSGAGSLVAVLDAGFDTDHLAFSAAPKARALTKADGGEYYLSDKIPYARDYADGDADVGSAVGGTAAASIAAGYMPGAGDVTQEDGTVLHDFSFSGAAPDAQLALMKIVSDDDYMADEDAFLAALSDAVALGADAVLVNLERIEITEAVADALLAARRAGVPVLAGAGDVEPAPYDLPAAYAERDSLSLLTAAMPLTLVGAAADPYEYVSSLFLVSPDGTAEELDYVDSCPDYFGVSFAALMAGRTLRLASVPGYGTEEDYDGVDAEGALAVIRRGSITFVEKAQIAAAHGAVGMLVVDESGTTVRMALENAPIPGVMLSNEDGLVLFGAAADAAVAFPKLPADRALFSGSGMSLDVVRTVDCLAAGARVVGAYAGTGDEFVYLEGTYYAAAAAAGYVCRAAEYCRAAGIPARLAFSAAMQSASRGDAESGILSPRDAGAGYLSENGEYPTLLTADSVLCGAEDYYSSFDLSLRLYNPAAVPVRAAVTASLRTDAVEEYDGVWYLTGLTEDAPDVRLYLGDGARNLADPDARQTFVTMAAQSWEDLAFRLVVPPDARAALDAVFPNGCYVDGEIAFEAEDGTVTVQPFSVFFGGRTGAVADATPYGGGSPAFGGTTLTVYYEDPYGNEISYDLGTDNPYFDGGAWGMEYNVVNPYNLRTGWVELSLAPLRPVAAMTVVFRDEAGRELLRRSLGGMEKYQLGGRVDVPLWDFIALDSPEYVFPDGSYTCEITLTPRTLWGGAAPETHVFTFTLDSVRPTIDAWSVAEKDGRRLLTVEASDDRYLVLVETYGLDEYGYVGYGTADGGDVGVCAGTDHTSLVFDITEYDGESPLYVEVTDLAGNFTTIRLTGLV